MKIGIIGAGNIGARPPDSMHSDAGILDESWRQQPGTPAYCTELMADALTTALASAGKACAPTRRDALIKEFMAGYGKLTHDDIVMRNRQVMARGDA